MTEPTGQRLCQQSIAPKFDPLYFIGVSLKYSGDSGPPEVTGTTAPRPKSAEPAGAPSLRL